MARAALEQESTKAAADSVPQQPLCMYGRDLSRPNLGMDSVTATAAAAATSVELRIVAATVVAAETVIAEQYDEDQDDDPGIATTKTVHLSFLLSLLTLPYYVGGSNV